MKPKKPFMIEVGNDLARITPKGKVKLVAWEGSQFLTKKEAEAAIAAHSIENATVIEIIDQIRARF